jgi:hypothetical protein
VNAAASNLKKEQVVASFACLCGGGGNDCKKQNLAPLNIASVHMDFKVAVAAPDSTRSQSILDGQIPPPPNAQADAIFHV